MKRTLLVLAVLLACPGWVFSQQINNNGLEAWISSGPFEYPQSFFTQTLIPGQDSGVVKTSDAYSGQHAAVLQYVLEPTTTRYQWGQLYYSTANFLTVTGHPFAARPENMTFWYKYILALNDTAEGYVFLLKRDGTTQQVIGQGAFKIFTHTPVYTKAIVPIQYFSPDIPDSIWAFFSMGKIWDTIPQTTRFYLDDIQLVYSSNIKYAAPGSPFRAYPNPSVDILTVEHQGSSNYEIRIYNTAGTLLMANTDAGNTKYIRTVTLPRGLYFLNVRDKQGSETMSLIKN